MVRPYTKDWFHTRVFLIIVFLVSVVLYMFLFFEKDNYVHRQNVAGIVGYLIDDDENFFSDLVPKTFDLSIYERGGYRPRWLAFFIKYIDYNLFAVIYTHFPKWGYHLPMVIPAAFLQIAAVYFLIKSIWKTMYGEICLFVGAVSLFYPCYLTTTFWMYRTPKLMTGAVALFFLGLFLRFSESNESQEISDYLKSIVFSVFIFVLMTLDELTLCTSVMCFMLSLIWGGGSSKFCVNKRNFSIFGMSIVHYLFYYFVWGRYLFDIFTTNGMHIHQHQYRQIVDYFEWSYIPKAFFEYIYAGGGFFFSQTWLYIIFACVVIVIALKKLKKQKISLKYLYRSLVMFCLGYFLLLIQIVVHHPIYEYRDLWNSMYLLVPMAWMTSSFMYLIYHIYDVSFEKENNKKNIGWAVRLIIVSIIIYSSLNVEDYRTNFMKPYGGYSEDSGIIFIDKSGKLNTRECDVYEFIEERW